jgi:hypothetical protein
VSTADGWNVVKLLNEAANRDMLIYKANLAVGAPVLEPGAAGSPLMQAAPYYHAW